MPRAALIALCWLIAQPAAAAGPLDAVQATVDAVLAVLRDPQLKSDRSTRTRRVEELLRARFDFEEMAKRSLGSNWAKQSAEHQQQFTRQFAELLMNNYIDRIEEYHGEKILYDQQRVEGDFASVDTRIQDQQGRFYSIAYRLAQRRGDWQVYDVVIEDISIVNNYRAQFTRLLNNGSFAELLKKLPRQAPPGAS